MLVALNLIKVMSDSKTYTDNMYREKGTNVL